MLDQSVKSLSTSSIGSTPPTQSKVSDVHNINCMQGLELCYAARMKHKVYYSLSVTLWLNSDMKMIFHNSSYYKLTKFTKASHLVLSKSLIKLRKHVLFLFRHWVSLQHHARCVVRWWSQWSLSVKMQNKAVKSFSLSFPPSLSLSALRMNVSTIVSRQSAQGIIS